MPTPNFLGYDVNQNSLRWRHLKKWETAQNLEVKKNEREMKYLREE